MPLLNWLINRAATPFLGSEQLLALARRIRLKNKIVVLMYHEIGDDDNGTEAWTIVRKSDFARQMEYVKKHYEVLGLADALQRMCEGGIERPVIVVTFDDGYSGNKKLLLPLVESMEIPVSIFVSTGSVQGQKLFWYDQLIIALNKAGPIEIDLRWCALGQFTVNRKKAAAGWKDKQKLLSALKTLAPLDRSVVVDRVVSSLPISKEERSCHLAPLTIEEVRSLAKCRFVTIGAHSHCHNILTQIPAGDMRNSIRRSKELLESWIERPIQYFAYPNGNYNNDVIIALKDIGVSCGLTTIGRPWAKSDSPYTLPRVGIGRYDSFQHFKAKISGLCRYP